MNCHFIMAVGHEVGHQGLSFRAAAFRRTKVREEQCFHLLKVTSSVSPASRTVVRFFTSCLCPLSPESRWNHFYFLTSVILVWTAPSICSLIFLQEGWWQSFLFSFLLFWMSQHFNTMADLARGAFCPLWRHAALSASQFCFCEHVQPVLGWNRMKWTHSEQRPAGVFLSEFNTGSWRHGALERSHKDKSQPPESICKVFKGRGSIFLQ